MTKIPVIFFLLVSAMTLAACDADDFSGPFSGPSGVGGGEFRESPDSDGGKK